MLAEAPALRLDQRPGTARLKSVVEQVCRIPAAAIEILCRRAYTWHLRRRAAFWQSPGQVRLEPDCLKLHTRSHRRSILDRFSTAIADAMEMVDHVEPRVAP